MLVIAASQLTLNSVIFSDPTDELDIVSLYEIKRISALARLIDTRN